MHILYVCKMLSMENIKTICVCGAGTMGSGIAQVAAQAGYKTIQFDLQTAMLEKSKSSIETALQKLFEKGNLSATEKERIESNILYTTDITQCKADVVIEAIIEKKEEKVDLFKRLGEINSNRTIFATNTSSISVTEIAAATNIASLMAGMHFFNPAPVMKLVEVVRTAHTEELVVAVLVALAKQMGKTPVVCRDVPGFIVNRVARHYYLEAMLLVEQGLADIETVDMVMESTGFRMGPFKLMDLIGIDVNYTVSNIVWDSLGKPERLKPSLLQKEKVAKGELGRKTGKGFYQY